MKSATTFRFSLAISHHAEIIVSVRDLKLRLQKRLMRNYISVDFEVQITLFTFLAAKDDYLSILREFRRILAGLKPFELNFSGLEY